MAEVLALASIADSRWRGTALPEIAFGARTDDQTS
jgi:hypothetical protein